MAGGWAKDGAVQEQIDASVADAVMQARAQLASGTGSSHCDECDSPIPLARQKAMPGTRLCIYCQQTKDSKNIQHSMINRSGSKNSQLR
jgi:phage/conjugal plasmid C-4 type zinc finger TraR family protein